MDQKYVVNQYTVESILNWVKDGEIAIPEIQRPFLWSTTKVRNFMDSLYQCFPVGYIIVWKNPDVRLKDGTLASGKKIVIDGQQRISALRAAILGEKVVNDEYRLARICIAFHPIKEEFATLTPAIKKDPAWIDDISEVMKGDLMFDFVRRYSEKNPSVDRDVLEKNMQKLFSIKSRPVGFIELAHDLDIETVTEIFIRINSEGVPLSQADFAMSKIASQGKFGSNLRKCVDYFCHLAQNPSFYKQISENDKDFAKTEYLQKIAWIKNDNSNIYDPSYSDVLRVSFTKEFGRGKLSELVSLLSGRNFETKTYEKEIVDKSFKRLEQGVLNFVSETHFNRFLMILRSAGFVDRSLISSQNAVDFAYIVYLKLRELKYNSAVIEKYAKKWFVMSLLTMRYSSSPESKFDFDIKNIAREGIEKYFEFIEKSELSDTFWESSLVRSLQKATLSNPFIDVFFAAQVYSNNKGFLSSDITIRDLINHGDLHHIFPKEYLKTKYNSRSDYNQIANLVYAQSEINIKIGKKAPRVYLNEALGQCQRGKLKYGCIENPDDFQKNLRDHCIPEIAFEGNLENYMQFLDERRELMARRIRRYYKSL